MKSYFNLSHRIFVTIVDMFEVLSRFILRFVSKGVLF